MILTVTANPAIDKAYFVDSFTMGQVHRPLRVSATAGGKGLNVARVAHILGTPTTAMGFIGGGAGEFIRRETEKLGITPAFTPIRGGETRTCINIADRNGLSGELLEPGPPVTEEEKQAFLEQFLTQLKTCRMVCVSGSLPKGLDASFYCQLVQLARAKDRKIIVDTSGSALQAVMEAGPYMIKPNAQELMQLLGLRSLSLRDIRRGLEMLRQRGISVPLVTMGGDGAYALVDGEMYHFTGPQVTVRSAVGSGDSTVAGIAVGLCSGMTVTDAIRLGLAAGTCNTQYDETGMVDPEMVSRLFTQIQPQRC